MKKLLILFIVIGTSMSSLYSQTKTIEGRLISEDFETLPQVSIMINDTVEVGRTDANGFFLIDIPITEKKIMFVFVGMESTSIELVDKCDRIEVVMMGIYNYDFMSLKRAERKRKKRYKKLSEIHKQAFEKGIFETEYACYNREFESLYLEDN
ncbi:hypothetical protein [Anaerophaga thermohalophila]|uniref:hypothetical protein n=1 Tax=Anaerophaga thermohalophila TaxID=177400 RepID=UPI001111C60B|nr:hypothetical protein [Anaerophaga thermohalophila]